MMDSQLPAKIQALAWVMDANSILLAVLQFLQKAQNITSRQFFRQTKTPERDALSVIAEKYSFH
jgi:hypothetical protein